VNGFERQNIKERANQESFKNKQLAGRGLLI
jgi:hypothetical protein